MNMGTKRILFVAFVVVAVLALTVLLLFQSGVDEKVIDALLPKVEKRVGVRITYKDIDASLTSISLNEVEIREREENCILAVVDRLGVGFRVGPLFFGDVDLTGIRLDGLEIRIGDAVSGCAPNTWKKTAQRLRKRGGSAKDNPSSMGRPELFVASGKVRYDDSRFAFTLKKLSGRADDTGKAAFEIEDYVLNGSGVLKVDGTGVEIRYAPEDGRIIATVSGPTIHMQEIRGKATQLLHDLEKTLSVWGNNDGNTSPDLQGASDGGVAPFTPGEPASGIPAVSVSFSDTTLILGHVEATDADWAVNDVSADFLYTESGDISVRATGRLPGTDARFSFNVKKDNDGAADMYMKVPDMSLAELGNILFNSPHVDWRNASLDGEFHLTLEENGQAVVMEGRSVFTNLSIGHPRLSTAPIHDLNVSMEYKLRYDRQEGNLNIERLLVSRDLFRATIRGDIRFDRVAFDLNLNIPNTPCRQIAHAIPDPLKPKLKNTVFDGNLSADIHLALDANTPEETILDVNLNNQCRVEAFGDVPEPNYFRGPFAYVAYTETEEPLRLVTGPGTDRWTSYRELSPFLIEAVLTTEDGKFWSHNGITLPEVRRAIELNLKADTMSHGASTITMQLAKNLFLNRERTVERKLQELVFVWYLESYFSKEELLELYFNVVEFGPSVYGISDASIHYFGREPGELNALESVFLIKLLPNPVERHKTYDRGAVSPRLLSQLHRVLRTMRDRKRLSDAELQEALGEQIQFHKDGDPFPEPRETPYHQLKGRSFSDETMIDPMVDDGQAF